MKNRSELFSIFQSFYHEIYTQFGVPICTLHSENAWEYSSQPFQNFMASYGSLHQTSYAHTPQQNGVVKWKNWHLIKTTRTLLVHGDVPFHFWGDAVFTICYLTNRMPLSILYNQVPYSVLFPKQPLHSLRPCIFGSTYFVHNLTPGLDKLLARSLNCVFLGYTRSQKGYRCFSLALQCYFVSVDVSLSQFPTLGLFFFGFWAYLWGLTSSYHVSSSSFCLSRHSFTFDSHYRGTPYYSGLSSSVTSTFASRVASSSCC